MTGGGFAEEERLARLRLARTDGIGAVGFAKLIDEHGSGLAAVAALHRAGKALADDEGLARECERVARIEARHVHVGEADYPPLLGELRAPPPVLVAVGDLRLAARPVVAIVGARNASAAGMMLATEFAEGLGAAGVVVASGMARGVDGAAHRASLTTGTIACVAGGVDIPYPPENTDLQWQVAENGLLLSEAPPQTQPVARLFPRRNRLIAGVALAVVVVEGAKGSGSLITARLAADAGRDVLAVPGHPKDPRSKGGNALIRDGAALVETADDILAALGLQAEDLFGEGRPERRPPAHDAEERRAEGGAGQTGAEGFLHYLTVAPMAVDELVRLSGRKTADVQAELTALELAGKVERVAGGRVRRVA